MNNLINAVLNRKFQLFDFLEKKIPDHHHTWCKGEIKGINLHFFMSPKGIRLLEHVLDDF